MASPAQHYTEAEYWIDRAVNGVNSQPTEIQHQFWKECVVLAQVHATLANAPISSYMPAHTPRSSTDNTPDSPGGVPFHGGGIVDPTRFDRGFGE